MNFAKGHEAHDDFVLLLDLPAALSMQKWAVRALCDRRRGIGAAAVLRVTVAGSAREAGVFDLLPDGLTADDWYMDRHDPNGLPDGGDTGIHLFAHYLWAAGLERRSRYLVGTASGARTVEIDEVDAVRATVAVTGAGGTTRGSSVLVAQGTIDIQWFRIRGTET
ncbi:hypothetical protein [Mycobacterium sp. 94-17]|uniref:hypothetical protein n=1 Tax=Mycobacterium sp. 94-17 TaxID=2986147 RepID=UPI002D1F1CAD|nr:hypothetical protein [Mycobacterium sp. 94-17]MEB4209538.1 hypothetical protein [Mycobacterium sp. 94-17]